MTISRLLGPTSSALIFRGAEFVVVIPRYNRLSRATGSFLSARTVASACAGAFPNAEEFLSSNRLRIATCLIADVRMPGKGGLEFYARLAVLGAPIPTILVTAYPNDQIRERALNAGVAGYLIKPFSEQELLGCISLTHGQEVLYAPLKR